MFGKSWIQEFLSPLGAVGQRRPRRRKDAASHSRRVRPHLEALEDRCLPSAVVVTTNLDVLDGKTTSIAALKNHPGADGAISLREAILASNNTPGANSITFAPGLSGLSFKLTQGELSISNAVTITGLGAVNTTVDAQHNSRIFDITAAAGAVTLNGLTLTNGLASLQNGGGIESQSSALLTVNNSIVSGSTSTAPPSGSYTEGHGGGICAAGPVALNNSTISGNLATYEGGGIYGAGAVTVSNSTISGNLGAGGIVTEGTLAVNNSTISGNVNGGLFAYYGAVTLSNSTVSNNLGHGVFAGDGATVTSCTISGNSVGGDANGGGLEVVGNVTVSNSNLTGNTGSYGGALYDQEGAVTITNSTISGNIAGRNGGGICSLRSSAPMTVSNSTISGNSAIAGETGSGGGIYSGLGSAPVTVSNSIVSGNSAQEGGGINAAFLTVNNSIISGNSASLAGGGLEAADLTLTNSTVSGNHAFFEEGGGIWLGVSSGASTISNSTISGNSAGGLDPAYGGGAVYVADGGGVATFQGVTISNSTVSGNSATGAGGGIFAIADSPVTSVMTLRSSIVAGNSGNGVSPDLGLSPAMATTVSNSLIGNNAGSGLTEAPVGAADANGNFIGGPIHGVINPLLGPLAFNGGPTPTMALLAGSPAIATGANPGNLTSDQRGLPFARTVGGQTDMGAFERQTLITTTTLTSSKINALVGQIVSFTATVVNPGGGMPTGMVTFWDGSTQLGSGVVSSSGQATITTAALSVGTHTITAIYGGDANFLTSTSTVSIQILLPAQEEIGLVVNQVNALVTAGVLPSAKGAALIVKLDDAAASLNSGDINAGVKKLNAAIDQVNTLVTAGKLDSFDAATLISDIELAIAAAGAG